MNNLEHQKPNGEWVKCEHAMGKCRYPQRQKQSTGKKAQNLTQETKLKPTRSKAKEDVAPYLDRDNPKKLEVHQLPHFLNSDEITVDEKVEFAIIASEQKQKRNELSSVLNSRKWRNNKDAKKAFDNTIDYSDEYIMAVYKHAEANGYSDRLPWRREPVLNARGEKIGGNYLVDGTGKIMVRTRKN